MMSTEIERKRIYFARAIDGIDKAERDSLVQQVSQELGACGLEIVDPVAMFEDTSSAEQADAIVVSDLAILKASDGVLMDLSRISHFYVGCICELVYAHMWHIPAVVYVGDSALGRRPWLQYHADLILRERKDAIAALSRII